MERSIRHETSCLSLLFKKTNLWSQGYGHWQYELYQRAKDPHENIICTLHQHARVAQRALFNGGYLGLSYY